MKRLLVGSVAVGLMAGTAMADVTYTPLQGTYGAPFNNGQIHGFTFTPTGGGAGGGTAIANVYDNILTINGGAATAGFFGPFADIPGTQAFVDWVGSTAQWTDDLHGMQIPDGISRIHYGYSNTVATSTHIIKLYDMVPPSVVPSDTSTIQQGVLLASIMVPANPTGAFLVTVTGLSFQVGGSAWVKFEEVGPGFPGTLWLTGGAGNGVGFSHPGMVYSRKTPYVYNLWVPFPSFYFPNTGYVASNVQFAMHGPIPGPATISLLGFGGLVALRRRRARGASVVGLD